MTERAVNKFVGLGIVSEKFRKNFIAGLMTREEIAAVDNDLDVQDVNAIVIALMNSQGFPSFSEEIDFYINRRYGAGRPSGDNLPISV